MKETFLYRLLRPVVSIYMKLIYKPQVIYEEPLDFEGPFIFAGTHTSFKDCLLIASLTNKPLRFLAKKELLDPPFGIFFRFAGIIPVNRKIKDKTVLPAASNVLKENYVVVIFPEGTINKTDDLIMPFKKGAAKLAIDNNCKIVPFAINGIYKRNQIIIKIGKKYSPKTNDVEKETKVLENKVTTLLESVIKNEFYK